MSLGEETFECNYDDLVGTWIFRETERMGNYSLECLEAEPVVHTMTITLLFPNIALDEDGKKGTWTMVYQLGFEVM